MKNLSKIIILLIVVFSLAACSESEVLEPEISYEGSLMITHNEEIIEVPFNDIYSMESQTVDMVGISSSGEEENYNFTGVKLNDILADYDMSQSDFSFIRLQADDGYAIDVPKEILESKDILLSYKQDGEVLEERKMPLRSAIEGERSMYYVSNLTNIELIDSNIESGSNLETIVFLDTAATILNLEDYTYYESVDKAVKATSLLDMFSDSDVESVEFTAVDDFEKTEMMDVVNQGYIKMTGENNPLFLAPDLPKGMHTKDILTMNAGDVIFVSLESSLEYFDNIEVNGYQGVSLEEILSLTGLNAESYIMEASDGYTLEIPHNDLVQGIISKDEDIYRVRVPEQLPKNYNLKEILSITSTDTQAVEQVEVEEDDQAALTTEWEIVVSGLSDGSFTMTSDRANSKLELTKVQTSIVKDDENVKETWQGYKVLDVLEFLKVDEFNSLEFIAVDGFSVEIPSEEIDENSILAVIRNGEEMNESDNLVRLVLDSPVSSNWIKGVVEIVVK
ncbi:MAG: molybdopterin-dependent oxidoreductase [Clostridia bacterium]